MSAEYTPCKVCLVEGYLGAGKTTLLNKVLAQPNGHRIAVIVNDIGEINIDARLIEKSGGGVTMQDGDLIPLTNGCICCTLSEDLAQQLSDLACSNKYDYIVIEASGICEPMPIAQTITMMSEATKRQGMPEIVHVDNIVAVVDAARLKDEFSCGEVLREVPEDEEDLASLLIQQIEFCDTIMLNKCDLVTEEELQQIEAVLRALQTRAKIIRCEYGDVPMEEVLDTDRFNYEEVAMSAGWIQAIENDDEDHDEHHDEHHHHDHDHEDHDHEEGHGHGHHHHHADEVFTSWGRETGKKYTKETIETILKTLNDEETYGFVLRAKGMVASENGQWVYFDMVPGELEVRDGAPEFTGRICVIGSKLKEDAIAELFGV